jgi:ribosome-associated protein
MTAAAHNEGSDRGGGAVPGGVEVAPGVRVPAGVLRFAFSSSSGPGGQNVNKRATKAELRVRIGDLPIHGEARARLAEQVSHLVTEGGELVIAADEHRSQARNKDACLERLRALVIRAMVRPKPRRKTRPSRGSVERRLTENRVVGERKRRRRGGDE